MEKHEDLLRIIGCVLMLLVVWWVGTVLYPHAKWYQAYPTMKAQEEIWELKERLTLLENERS